MMKAFGGLFSYLRPQQWLRSNSEVTKFSLWNTDSRIWFLKLTQMWCCLFSHLFGWAVKTFRGKGTTYRGPKEKEDGEGGCLTRAFAPIIWQVTGEKPQDSSKPWQLYRKGETARVLGFITDHRASWRSGTVFRQQLVSGSMGCLQDGGSWGIRPGDLSVQNPWEGSCGRGGNQGLSETQN